MSVAAVIDQPAVNSINDPLCLRIVGWAFAGRRDMDIEAIEIHAQGRILGETRIRVPRPDVVKACALPLGTPTGFELFVSAPELFGKSSVHLECHTRFRDGSRALGTTQEINLIAHDHRTNHYGILARQEETRLFHRDDIYCTGPSVAECDPTCLELVKRYLGAPPCKVLDVGCGFGSYGRRLLPDGYDWLGVEVKGSDCVELARLALPHRLVDGRTMPFANGDFDSAISIEVLEHIADTGGFLSEIRRVTRRRLLVSVPNLELIPYLHRNAVVPWHLLEGDHKNFFTRSSLKHLLSSYFRHVEVLCYNPHPLTTSEGVPLYYHLFAICDV